MVGPIPSGHFNHFNMCPPDYEGACDRRSFVHPCLGR
jgi:hypothetical protein